MSVIPICSKSPRPRTYSGAALVSALWCRLSVTSTSCSRCVRSESVCSWAESDKPGDIIQPHSIIATLCMRIHTIPSIFSKDYCLSIFLEMRKPYTQAAGLLTHGLEKRNGLPEKMSVARMFRSKKDRLQQRDCSGLSPASLLINRVNRLADAKIKQILQSAKQKLQLNG